MEPQIQYNSELSFEKVWAMFQETDQRFKETDRQIQETNRRFQETDRQIQETNRKFKETDQKFQETDRKFQETDQMFKETDRKFQETRKEIRASQAATQKIVSDLGRKFGAVVEHMFIPNLHKKFHQFGYTFGKSSGNVLIQDSVHQIFTQVDVLVPEGAKIKAW
jgi:hypothetical protein